MSVLKNPDGWREIPRIVESFGMGYRIKFRGGFFDHMYGELI